MTIGSIIVHPTENKTRVVILMLNLLHRAFNHRIFSNRSYFEMTPPDFAYSLRGTVYCQEQSHRTSE